MFKGFVREGELRRWAPWIGAALLVLMAVALETSMESVCWDDAAAKAAKVDEAAGCFEFWFNRYQTLIGAVAALAAAGVAWIGVRRQIDKADDQIAAAGRQNAIALLPVLDERIKHAMKIFVKAELVSQRADYIAQSSRRMIESAERIRLSYVQGQDIKNLMVTFNIGRIKHEEDLKAFSEMLQGIFEVQTDGLAWPALRRSAGAFWLHNDHFLKKNRAALFQIKSAFIKRNGGDGFTYHLVDINKFDARPLVVPENVSASLLNAIGRQVEVFQNERDQIFERKSI